MLWYKVSPVPLVRGLLFKEGTVMFDIKLIRENLENAKARLAAKNSKADLGAIAAKDLELRALQAGSY